MSKSHEAPPSYEDALASTMSNGASELRPPSPAPTYVSTAPSSHASRPVPPRPTSPAYSSTSSRPLRPQPVGPLPTTTAQSGHPLLYRDKLLLYPKSLAPCPSCYQTGYVDRNSLKPCKSCWRRYGKPYTGVFKQAYEQGGSHQYLRDMRVQQPLTFPTPMQGSVTAQSNVQRPNYLPPGAYAHPFASPGGSRPSTSGSRPDVFPEDAHNSAPPRYDVVSQTASEKPLAQQDYPVHPRPPPPRPQAPQHHSMYPMHPMAPPPPRPVPMMYRPNYQRFGPTIDWYGYQPPPNSIAVMPGDPRIGGVLCYKCGGSGNSNDVLSYFGFGDDECSVCGGTGRIPG